MRRRNLLQTRNTELILLWIFFAILLLGFLMVTISGEVQERRDPMVAAAGAILPPIFVLVGFLIIHLILRGRRVEIEQLLLPIAAVLLAIGLIMIWRLRGPTGVGQQLSRGFLPGALIVALLALRPRGVEWIRRAMIPIALVGLALPILTAFFGVVDETGARLALKLGPLPSIQTSELIKIALIIFLAGFIELEGEAAEGRAVPLFGRLRLPAARYFIPGALFVGVATLALVQMSDFGAVLILACLFVGMLYAGFETRLFATVAAIGLALALLVGLVLSLTWEMPTTIRYRFLAFRDPWSQEEIIQNGVSTGVTISQGPGYQIQQSVYALIAGGLTGTGLGFGSPEYVPLSASDFIFASVLEEMGAMVGIAILALFSILILRILRIALMLPKAQVFERLLLIGIAIHFFTQVFIMVGGTLNVIPLTGVTIPFMSQGGVALLVNFFEVGLVLAVAQRLEGKPA